MELDWKIDPLDEAAMTAARDGRRSWLSLRAAWDGWRSFLSSWQVSPEKSITGLKESICWFSPLTTAW